MRCGMQMSVFGQWVCCVGLLPASMDKGVLATSLTSTVSNAGNKYVAKQ